MTVACPLSPLGRGEGEGTINLPVIDASVLSVVRLDHVFMQHALRVEKRTVQRDGTAHHGDELLPVIVVQGNDRGLQVGIKRFGSRAVHLGITMANGPTGNAFNAAFDPLAIQDTERRHAIHGRFHAAGS
jgi:hypothetical protein